VIGLVEAVATNPIRLVTAASAESSVIGSMLAMYCAERASASGCASRTEMLSARNTMSILARSAVRAISA
jgi:hypothetical protein